MNDIVLVNIGSHFTDKFLPPLGILYLASYLESKGFKVICKDTQTIPFINKRQYKNTVLKYIRNPAKTFGFSCSTRDLCAAIQFAKEIKTDEKIIIFGGPGAAGIEEEILRMAPFIDIVVVGEGELTLAEIMQHIKGNNSFNDIKGVVYRINNHIIRNPPRERIRHLDILPIPAYSKLDIKNYRAFNIITQRGCPYRCTYCSESSFWGHALTQRSINSVIDEILLLKQKYNTKQFFIADDIFTTSRKRIYKFCNGLKKLNLNIEWICNSRIGLIDEKIMRRMADNGCINIHFGVESGSNRILKDIRKEFTVEEAEATIDKACKIFHRVVLFYIWGYPSETLKDFIDTLTSIYRLMNKHNNLNIILSRLEPFTNTCIYKQNADKVKLISNKKRLLLSPASSPLPKCALNYPKIHPYYYFTTYSIKRKEALLNYCLFRIRSLIRERLRNAKKRCIASCSIKLTKNHIISKYKIVDNLAGEYFKRIISKSDNQKDLIQNLKLYDTYIKEIIGDKSFYKAWLP